MTLRTLLGALALAALHAVILLTPALAAGAQPEPKLVCYTRPLDQGSGNVRVCEVRP